MAKNLNTSCDGCGRIVFGTDRGRFVREANIFINGQIGENIVDKETGYKSVEYMTPTAEERLCFCKETFFDCLNQYIETRKMLNESKRVRMLREQAGLEANDRLYGGN